MKTRSKILHLILMITTLPSCYSLSQAFHFNDLYNSRIKVSEALDQKVFAKPILEKLERSREILSFAKSQKLFVEESYQYYIHTESPAVSYLVQAAEPFQFKLLTWWFPFTGAVPYLGYFDEDDRDRKAQDLREQGYDVATSYVGAFSSLGWFDDPLYSSMVLRSEADLAHLLFHELIHRTIWISNSVTFNENMAEFGAGLLTRLYLEKKGMLEELKKYESYRRDLMRYRRWLISLRQELEKLYRRTDISTEEKKRRKSKVIQKFLTDDLPKFESSNYQSIRKKEWNNAYILGASLYLPDIEVFMKAYECAKRPLLGDFLKSIRERYSQYQNADEALESYCMSSS